MVESLRDTVRRGVAAYASGAREQFVLEWPSQVVLVVTAIFWTLEVTEALGGPGAGSFTPGALAALAARNTSQLGDVVNLVRGDLSKLARATLSALVVMDVHARDVAQARLCVPAGVAWRVCLATP
jgi:dynein heavy chain, axonemal